MLPFIIVMFSAVLYLSAAGLGAYQVKNKEKSSSLFTVVYFVALILHSIAIGVGSVSRAGTLIQGPNILMLASWTLALIFTIFEILNKRPYSYVTVIAPIIVFMMLTAQFLNVLLGGETVYNAVYEQWPVLVIHIAMFFIGISCFIIAAVAAGLLIYQGALARKDQERFFNLKLPALDTLRKIMRRVALAGLPFFTVGILLGIGRFMAFWGVSPEAGTSPAFVKFMIRILFSSIVWFIFSSIAILNYLVPGRLPSRTIALATVAGGILSLILLVISSIEMA